MPEENPFKGEDSNVSSKSMEMMCITYMVEDCGDCGHYHYESKCSLIWVDYIGGGEDGGNELWWKRREWWYNQ